MFWEEDEVTAEAPKREHAIAHLGLQDGVLLTQEQIEAKLKEMTDHREKACAWITSKVDEKMVSTANSLGIRKIDGQEASGRKDIATAFQPDGSEGMC